MSPLDDELRRTLTMHASDVEDSADFLTKVEHRARTIHRRRLAAGGFGGAAVVVAAVFVSLAVADNGGGNHALVPVTPPSGGPSASASPTGATAVQGADSVMHWPRVGAQPTWVRWDAVLGSLPRQMPADFAPIGAPSVVGTVDTDGGAVTVFVVPTGDHLVAAAVLRSDPQVAVAVHDIARDGAVPLVGVVVRVPTPSGPVDDGVVFAAPTTGQILFKLPGQAQFEPVEGDDPRSAAVTLGHVTPGDAVAQVEVFDGNGDLDHPAYRGPIQVGFTFPDV